MGFLSSIGKTIGKVANFIPGVNLVSSALDIGTDMFMSSRANDTARENSAMAYQMSRDAYKNRYQDTMSDMKSAGLNPILAASGGFNVGNSVTANVPDTFKAGAQAPMSSSALDFAKTKQAEEETKKTVHETKLVINQAKNEFEKIFETRARKGLVSEQERETHHKINTMMVTQMKMYEEASLYASKSALNEQERRNAVQLHRKLELENRKLNAEFAQIRNISNVYNHPGGQILTILSEILGSLGNLLKGINRR